MFLFEVKRELSHHDRAGSDTSRWGDGIKNKKIVLLLFDRLEIPGTDVLVCLGKNFRKGS